MYVVTGATGNVGSAVVDHLLSHSVPVRVVIRSENKAEPFRKRNIDVVIADIKDAEALTKAFQGAKSVFAMSPPDYAGPSMEDSATSVSHALASAIKATNVERVVVLSSIGGERSSKTGNIITAHILEENLKDSAPEVVMVRAASFLENWRGAFSAVKSGHSPVIGSTYQKLDQKLPHVSTNDIGYVVAEYMIKPKGEVNKLVIIELEGPEPCSPNDVALITSQLLGKSVVASAMTEDMLRQLLENQHGWSKSNVDKMIEMSKGFDDKIICWSDDNKYIRIQGKVTLADVLKNELK